MKIKDLFYEKVIRNKRNFSIITSVIIVIIISLGFYINMDKDLKKINFDEIIEICNDKTMEQRAECVEDITRKFYKVNTNFIGEEISFKTLRDEGGTCSHWSKYWCDIGKEYGYFTKTDNFTIKKIDVSSQNLIHVIEHEVCVWSSEEGLVFASNNGASFEELGGLNISYELILNELYG